MGFFSVQNQTSESYGNGKTTLENGGRNPPDVTLDDIAKDLLSFFNGFQCLHKTKKNIEEKYDIKSKYGDSWSADDIKRAWGKTQRMDKKSDKRKHWARVIILQMLKRLVYDGCKQNAAQEVHDDTANEIKQTYETTPGMKEHSNDTSSESNDELQIWSLHASKYKLTEESVVVSEGQLSASSTDVAATPTEVNSNNSETKNDALVNENKDSLVNNCEQQKSIDNHKELNFTDKPDQKKAERENGRWEDVLWSTVDINLARGKAESMKENSEGRSSQSSDELETVGAAGGDKQRPGANRKSTKSGLSQTGSASQDRSGARIPTGGQATRNYPGAPDDQSGTDVSSASESEEPENHTVDEITYICIPFTKMFANEQTEDNVENVRPPYKLIDGFPSDTDLRIRKSYAMSFSSATNNAEWVYEILNSESLKDNCKTLKPFGNDYHKGHLAASANHRWCREANHDTNLFSNIIPQNKKLNQGMWKKLENRCRKIQKENRNCNVHVYTGPLYLRETNDAYSRVNIKKKPKNQKNPLRDKVIPTHLFKVIIVEDEDGTVEEPECYMIPNKNPEYENLNDYKLQHDNNLKFIEDVSGLTFIQHPNVNLRDHRMTVTLQGECGNGESCSVDIGVRIST